ncbi:AIPR family protein [Variovorax sp. Root434]|uniref:AIPR family protein n=1 Tax=Variovorax sp. Root434 TaxID=1736536 RepID=UPI000AB0A683|nr:AIPR family protein [Variovorax sp. Root434]
MSSLKVSQIKQKVRSMFEAHLDLADIGAQDSERDQKILSRCLAALAVYLQAGCSEKEAALAVWDGSDDNGIDAAFFDPSDLRVILVQSKWINKGSGEPEAKDLGAFTKGARDIIEQDNTGFRPALHTRFGDIALRLANPGTSVHLVVVSTGASALAKHGAAILKAYAKDMNGDDPDAIATFEVMGLAEVYSGLAHDPTQSNVAVDATLLDWSYISSPYQAYFGLIDGLQLKGWWKTHGKGLVASNIRHALGSTEVNNEIKQTATLSPEKFWYFNNGITLVASEAAKAPAGAASRAAGNFSFKGSSIVNGAQTVSSLAKVDDDHKLALVRVPVKVILLKGTPAGFGDEVTRTNNLQNKVEPRDFVAQDPEQKRIRQEMAIEGIDYQFVRSEDAVQSPTSCELIEVTTALACAAEDPALTVQLKTGIGRFFIDLTKAPYKTIFNPSVSGAKAFNAVLLNREIEKWIEQTKGALGKKSGVGWGALVHGNRILTAAVFNKYGTSKLLQPIVAFSGSLSVPDLDKICEDAYMKMVAGIETDYNGKFLAVLFKNPTMSKRVYELARA